MELTEKQQQVYGKLCLISESMGNRYISGLMFLEECEIPDYIEASANSFRHISIQITNEIKSDRLDNNGLIKKIESEIEGVLNNGSEGRDVLIEMKKMLKNIKDENNKKDTMAIRLSKAIDPKSNFVSDNSVYKKWNTFHKFFTEASHYGDEGEGVPEGDLREQIGKYEDFLLETILKSDKEVLEEIDAIVKSGSKNANSDRVKELLARSVSTSEYFFSSIDESWLEFLEEHDFFTNSPIPILLEGGQYIRYPLWSASRFLSDIANKSPQKVSSIIYSYPVHINSDKYNPRVTDDFIEACIKLPFRESRKIIKKMINEKWGDADRQLLFAPKVIKLLEKLISEEEYKTAIRLTNILLRVKTAGRSNVVSYYREYDFSETLKVLDLVPPDKSKDFIEMILCKIIEVIDLECGDRSNMFSYRFESFEDDPIIEDIHSVLISSLIDLSTRYFDFILENSPEKIVEELESFFNGIEDYKICNRIKAYFLLKYSESIKTEITSFIFENICKPLFFEFNQLVNSNYGELPQKDKSKILGMIEVGPGADLDYDERQIKIWKIRRYYLISAYLKGKDLSRYKELIKEFDDSEPTYLLESTRNSSSWVGPTSSLTFEAVSKMKVGELIDYLKNWIPPEDDFGNSPEGLGEIIVSAIEASPLKYYQDVELFKPADIPVEYFVFLIRGFSGCLRQSLLEDSEKICFFISEMYELVKAEEYRSLSSIDNPDYVKNPIYKSILHFIKLILQKDLLPQNSADRVWKIISDLTDHPDPTPETDDNKDPYSTAINSVRGEAFHCVFEYYLWRKRNTKELKYLPNEIKEVVDKGLDKSIEKSLAVRSVYGIYLSVLLGDEKWFKENIEKIFPSDDYSSRHAVWDTYILGRTYLDMFSLIQDKYSLAIDDLPKQGFKGNMRYSVEGLAGHIANGFLFDMPLGEDLLKQFFKRASPEQQSLLVSYVGRVYISSSVEKRQDLEVEKFKNLWTIILEESKSNESIDSFGWWFVSDFWEDDDWLLKQMIKTLDISKGKIDVDYKIVEELKGMVETSPALSLDILYKIVSSKESEWRLSRDEDIRDILVKARLSDDEVVEQSVSKIVDYMIRLGKSSFRDI